MAELTKRDIHQILQDEPERIVMEKIQSYDVRETQDVSQNISVMIDNELIKTKYFFCQLCPEGNIDAIVSTDIKHRRFLLKQHLRKHQLKRDQPTDQGEFEIWFRFKSSLC